MKELGKVKAKYPKEEGDGSEAGEVNICQLSDSACSEKTIKEMAQRIVWDNLSERDVKVISRTLVKTASDPILEITRASNKIQQEHTEQRKNEGLHYSEYFSLESVKKWLDLSLEKNKERARQLLTWIQEAIISGALKDLKKLGSTYLSSFLKKDEYIPKPYEPLLPNSLHKLGSVFAGIMHMPKNLSKSNTYARKAL
ncbi:hypothetical protein C1645_836586 [Glomus cerebriforme]|uniref:Uncharacterized protein n=1 Tax=Glomus cerebriforme TaxID=658196 RepID=A0A397SA21_9GLOM|nr:hypothetical protein C1645_836586 [Glomus cerebriforme]